MTKIMLVEDDKSLREIYSIRLVAEGYEVVSAGDGEEALALAVQQRPDLIVSDVMMPKISGFDMLDILRSTPETKDIKVIMMTALSSDDQRQRGESLGADKYLVKSQVGIEDVINAVHEVLGDKTVATSPDGTAPDPTAPTVASQPMGAQPTEAVAPAAPVAPKAPTPAAPEAQATVTSGAPAAEPAVTPAEASAPTSEAPETPAPVSSAETAEATSADQPAATPQSANSAAMDELLNNTPDENNATWPGNTAQ